MNISSAENFLGAINLHLKTDLILDKIQVPNRTTRSRTTLLAHDANRKYVIEIATNQVQQYYLQKNIDWPLKYLEHEDSIKYLVPIWHGSLENFLYAVFQYENILGFYDKQPPANFLSGFTKRGQKLIMNGDVLDLITDGFLKGWPPRFHEHIRRLDHFQEWRFLTSQENFVNLVNEHGDYSPNNILVTPEGPVLIDFEFAKTDQIDGFDLYYNETTRKVAHSESNVSIRKLHQVKLALCHAINNDLDFDRTGVIFHVPRLNQQSAQDFKSSLWIEILDYPGASAIKLMPFRRGITLGNSEEALASRNALEALPDNIASKLASRWHYEKISLYAMEISVGCSLSNALLRYRLIQIFHNAKSFKETLKILRRLLSGKLYFSWHRSIKSNSSSLKFYHGNLKDYLTHRAQS